MVKMPFLLVLRWKVWRLGRSGNAEGGKSV